MHNFDYYYSTEKGMCIVYHTRELISQAYPISDK